MSRNEADLDGFLPWVTISLGDEEHRILAELVGQQRSGGPASLSAAARAAGVNPATARAWKARHPAFGEAVEVVLSRAAPKPVVEPEPVDPIRQVVLSRERLEAELRDAKLSLRHELRRERLGLFSDAGQARGRLRRTEARLKTLSTTPWELPTPREDAW